MLYLCYERSILTFFTQDEQKKNCIFKYLIILKCFQIDAFIFTNALMRKVGFSAFTVGHGP